MNILYLEGRFGTTAEYSGSGTNHDVKKEEQVSPKPRGMKAREGGKARQLRVWTRICIGILTCGTVGIVVRSGCVG
jgi:hypothetical protein